MNIGSAPVTLRLTVDAGMADAPLSEVGHAETTIHLPVTATTDHGVTRVHVDHENFADTVQAIITAASTVINPRHGIAEAFADPTPGEGRAPDCPEHHPVQHRDAKPPWCNACGMTEGRVHHDCFPGVSRKG